MPGLGHDSSGLSVFFADNVDFTGAAFPTATVKSNAQLLIGSTIAPNIRVGQLVSPLGTITLGYAAPNITMDITGGLNAIEEVNVQAGTSPIVPTAGAITINGATVAAGTNPVRTDGTGVSTMAVQVQISQALAAADATKIGLANFNSGQFSVDANGFVSSTFAGNLTITPVTFIMSPYTVLVTDQFLAVDTTGGPVVIKLPNAPTTGRVIYIKDSKGNAAVNSISVTTVGGAVTIDGLTTYTLIANYEAIEVIFDSAAYEVF